LWRRSVASASSGDRINRAGGDRGHGLDASILVARASNRPALWNVFVGGAVVAALALVLCLPVVVVERITFE
jgi:hypothetical protein